jgi:hypothetical protein
MSDFDTRERVAQNRQTMLSIVRTTSFWRSLGVNPIYKKAGEISLGSFSRLIATLRLTQIINR